VALGDDTREALNGAPCAVAIVARGYGDEPRPFAKIGVAYNASPESRQALAAARELAGASRASTHVLQVVEIPTIAYTGIVPIALGESIETLLENAREQLDTLPDVEARAVYGLAGEELAAFAKEVDLLVVGSRSYGPIRRLINGSTSAYLQRHSRSSLLVLPRGSGPAGSDAGPPQDERVQEAV
jgi:nucleotide-binding universal stress UspA family protein